MIKTPVHFIKSKHDMYYLVDADYNILFMVAKKENAQQVCNSLNIFPEAMRHLNGVAYGDSIALSKLNIKEFLKKINPAVKDFLTTEGEDEDEN